MSTETTKNNGEIPHLVKYDGRFWRTQKRQSMLQHFGIFTDLRDLIWNLTSSGSWKDIKLKSDLLPIQLEQNYDGDFIVNGVNDTMRILGLQSLTGLSIKDLEKRMLPDDRTFDEISPNEYYGSNSDFGGFIKPGESLLEILTKDNNFVLAEGTTHQQIAEPMLQIFNAWLIYAGNCYLHFTLNGKEFLSGIRGFPMFQHSPFNDGIEAPGYDITVTDLATDKKFFFAPLCPFLIHRYGFYEGNVPYRVDPKEALDFFY